jgi:glycosyltransferase involved in cell wall biosynthesis
MARREAPLVALVDVSAKMGGVEFSTLYLAQRMDRAKFRPLVICPEEGDLPKRCRESGVPVEIVRQPRLLSSSLRIGKQRLPNPLSWLINCALFVIIARRVARSLRQASVTLVCTKGIFAHFYGGLAARMAGVPCVWHVQDLIAERYGGLYMRLLGMAGRLLAAHVIADGTPIQAQWRAYLPEKRLHLIYNGVDVEQFSPQVDGSAVRAEWQADAQTLLIGNVARLTAWKGQDYLVRAFAQIADAFPQAKLVLVGSPVFDNDAFEQRLRQLAEPLGERVIFAGFRWDLPQVLAALDIYAHVSVEKDTSPLSVVSAAASGKPILCTAVEGVTELFTPDRDAVIVPPKDVSALAEALRALLNDAARRAALGKAARQMALEKLSLDQFARNCEAVFERALRHDR